MIQIALFCIIIWILWKGKSSKKIVLCSQRLSTSHRALNILFSILIRFSTLSSLKFVSFHFYSSLCANMYSNGGFIVSIHSSSTTQSVVCEKKGTKSQQHCETWKESTRDEIALDVQCCILIFSIPIRSIQVNFMLFLCCFVLRSAPHRADHNHTIFSHKKSASKLQFLRWLPSLASWLVHHHVMWEQVEFVLWFLLFSISCVAFSSLWLMQSSFYIFLGCTLHYCEL